MVRRDKIYEKAIYGDYLNLDLTSVKIYTYIHETTGKIWTLIKNVTIWEYFQLYLDFF